MPENPKPPQCMWCKAPGAWAKAGISTGFKVTAWCWDCARPATTQLAVSKTRFDKHVIDAMPPVEQAKVRCPICSKKVDQLEAHHVAPRELFGDEAELWPTVECCRACHERWHARMGFPINLAEAAEEA